MLLYENETTSLDFKRAEYRKEIHWKFLKDVLSMANAHVEGSRFIITGVHSPPGGPKEYLGIAPDEMRDSATYEQLVGENIEPAIALRYYPHELNGKTFGVFEISDCHGRPYQMKKEYGNLKRGEMWIRKGTHQMLLDRADLQQITEQLRAESGFSGEVTVAFQHVRTWPGSEMQVRPRRFETPSEKAEREIRSILNARASARIQPTWIPRYRAPFSFTPYAERTTEELQDLVARIGNELKDYDLYSLFGKHAEIVNFRLVNKGDEYLEDARFEVVIPLFPGILVSNNVYHEPINDWKGTRLNRYNLPTGYPSVRFSSNHAVVSDDVGNLRHQVATPAFDAGLRICFRESAAGIPLELKWSLHGKNLRRPLSGVLKILVSEKVLSDSNSE